MIACGKTQENNKNQSEKALKIEEKDQITDLKAEKITEYGAKITFNTITEKIAYVNDMKIDEVPRKNHFYYVTDMLAGTENIIKVRVDKEEKTVIVNTKEQGINYAKHPNGLQDRVFYQLFVRAFADSDGDGVGDFNGITENLDYLEYLGINALWLLPINCSTNYHGYDVTNYYELNKDYGTKEDFKRLLEEAHKRDIKIVMDVVMNHYAMRHPIFQSARRSEDAPYRDWFLWSDTRLGSGWELNAADN